MSNCSRCGNLVEFRYVGGRCIPIHPYGGCDTSITANDYSGFKESKESICFPTSCSKCGDEIFYIRHNGGSVWVELPLGPPWFKHLCMHPEKVDNNKQKTSLLMSYKQHPESIVNDAHIGVVKVCNVHYDKSKTELIIDIGKKLSLRLVCKNNGGFLLGKLCVFSKKNNVIYALEDPNLKYMLIQDFVKCPVCLTNVLKKNLINHIERIHKNNT
ncbi:hypothetical protein [Photobacterium damselae]|uniref:hypothetical protein n=1 Tax=Photobacterium damselae TaxID=38293 RepID=UPI001EFEE835|nr:hypothetical protein [Photobacterium damselae]MCG9780589.1 hypothetical protein [Photobacterium damselae]